MSFEAVITIRDVSKYYSTSPRPIARLVQELRRNISKVRFVPNDGDKRVLGDIDLNINRGEIVGLIGRNGAGKSTLLQILTGIIRPTTGTVEVNGRITALLELGSGFNPEFSGKDNVYLNAALYGLSIQEIDEKYEQIIEFSGIGEYATRPVKTYSSGMALRLAFAVMAHVNADILIIDEALAVGDALYVQKCMRFLKGFARCGTIVFVSHDLSAIKGFCNRVIWLEEGVVKLDGNPKRVCEAYLEYLHNGSSEKMGVPRYRPNRKLLQNAGEIDMRTKWNLSLGLRNDIQVIDMPAEAVCPGRGGALITSVGLYDDSLRKISWIVGGEVVNLRFLIEAEREISSPIAGFYVKDKLGQTLFGENTYLEYLDAAFSIGAGEQVVVNFRFEMPVLAIGDYSVTVAIAEGNQENFNQLHWFQDALVFKSVTSHVAKGMMGIKISSISMEVVDDADEKFHVEI